MTFQHAPSFDEMQAELEARGREAAKIADATGLPIMTAFIVAGDRASADKAWPMLATGPFDAAAVMVGSYARRMVLAYLTLRGESEVIFDPSPLSFTKEA